MNYLGEQHGLADARAAEEPGLAAALERGEDVNDLDSGLENLGFCGALGERRRISMDRTPLNIGHRSLAVDGVAKNIEHAGEDLFSDRRLQWAAGVLHRHAAGQALGRGESYAPHTPVINLGQHLDHHVPLRARAQN